MDQISEFFKNLFRADSWPARWQCGRWTEFHGWLYIISDLAIWAAYFTIPFFLVRFIMKKPNIPLPGVFWLFGIFIMFCGLTHLMDVLIFWWPNYRLSALLRFITAVVSLTTVAALYKFFPVALKMRTTREYENELADRKKSEARFIGLLESAPDAMVIADHAGKILLVNEQTERLFGFKRDEVIGREVEVLIPDRFLHKHAVHRKGYVKDPRVRAMGVGLDLFGKHKDGKEFPVAVSLSPITIAGEDEIQVISAIRDITKQKESEAEIKKLNENLEHLVIKRTAELELALNSEKEAHSVMNHNQQRLTFLTEATEILSSSLDYHKTLFNLVRIITPNIADWCAIDEVNDEGLIKRIVASHIDTGKTNLVYELAQKFPYGTATPDGIYKAIHTLKPELHARVSVELLRKSVQDLDHLKLLHTLGFKSVIIVPLLIRRKIYGVMTLVLAESGRIFDDKDLEFAKELARRTALAVENARLYKESQDINTVLEERVAKRTQELKAINRELESFSYSVSHDLRAPLRSIDGFSNKILKDYGALFDEQGKDYFMRVKNASQHMGRLIDDLLKLARLSQVEIHLEKTDLSVIAESIAAEFKVQNPESNAEFIIQPEMVAQVDRNLLQIALQNLLGNAAKYSKNQSHPKIEFGIIQKDGQPAYFVRDNGVGFDMKYVDKLFGAFQRLHSLSEFEGTGIGLATVQRIIRRHQGTTWATGEVNNGATFYFTL